MRKQVHRALAFTALATVYGGAWLAGLIGRCRRGGRWTPTGRIAVVGTFHNPNWYLSHIAPLTRSGAREVLLVVDAPQAPLPKVRFIVPPPWAARLLGRAGSKAVWLLLTGVRERPDLYMGYSLLPGACTALLAGAAHNRPACYQVTGGPVEILGGGCHKDGPLTTPLGGPSPVLERMATAAARQFDLVVVRGATARQFLRERGLNGACAVITGSIRPPAALASPPRDIDMIYVGRLEAVKQPWQFLEVVAGVRPRVSRLRAVVVGDGHLLPDLQRRAAALGVDDCVEFLGQRKDVEALVARARLFLLTSRSEGLSIAMAEAMTAGTVPVVPDVGDLGDLVASGRTGYLVTPNAIGEYVERVCEVLLDEGRRETLSQAAAEAAVALCSLDRVADRWRTHLDAVIVRMAGRDPAPADDARG